LGGGVCSCAFGTFRIGGWYIPTLGKKAQEFCRKGVNVDIHIPEISKSIFE